MLKVNLIPVPKCWRCWAAKPARFFGWRERSSKRNKTCIPCCRDAAKKFAEANAKNGGLYTVRCRDRNRKLRNDIIAHYGGKCACCGEPRIALLALDHINGGGIKHRKELGDSATSMLHWIRKNNYPPIFQILCHNCNFAKGKHGNPCPHMEERHLHPIDKIMKQFEFAGSVT